MIQKLFTQECLQISVSRTNQNAIYLRIGSDYSGSSRKSRLYVNEERLAKDVEDFWKSIKTKKLKKMNVSFSEIDWYDDMTDMYETPSIHIERGLKKARVRHDDHGSIPKDWAVDTLFVFNDTTTSTPIIEVVKSALGSHLSSKLHAKLLKELKPFLQKKIDHIFVGIG